VEMTAEQVQAAFRKWLRPDDFVQIVRGPQPK
jgi:zinc protease